MTDYHTIAESKNFIVLERLERDWQVAEGYQSEDALERELISDLVNQGYEFSDDIKTPRGHARQCARAARGAE